MLRVYSRRWKIRTRIPQSNDFPLRPDSVFGLKTASLTEVQRQTDQAYRQAIESLRRNPDTGFDRLEDIGAVREVAATDRARVVAAAYMDARTTSIPGPLRATHNGF
jgi:hypothetical protein